MNTIAMDTFFTVDLSRHMDIFLSLGNFMRGYILYNHPLNDCLPVSVFQLTVRANY